ncbi:MAG TPA: conjugal transfer protein TrbF [Ferrovibrio sp.]
MFRRAVNRYGDTPAPVTPYQKAAQVWDERIGSARLQARNWRLIAFGALLLSLILAGGLIWQAGRSRITPYVVEVDRLGEAQAVAPAVASYRPSDAQIAYHLARFIRNLRSLSVDPVIVRRSWLEAYDYVTERGAQMLNGFARARDPFKAIGERSVSVEILSVVRASPDSFQVRWREETWREGRRIADERWIALLTIAIRPPRDAATLRKNPLGIYVHGLDWSRELQPGASG